MSEESDQSGTALTMPLGLLGVIVALGIAGVSYAYMQRNADPSAPGFVQNAVQRATPGKNTRRKVGLMALIAIIENDTSRKMLLSVLRAFAKRS